MTTKLIPTAFTAAFSRQFSNTTVQFCGAGSDTYFTLSNGYTIELTDEQAASMNAWAKKIEVAKKVCELANIPVFNATNIAHDYDITGDETQDEIYAIVEIEIAEQYTKKLQAQY